MQTIRKVRVKCTCKCTASYFKAINLRIRIRNFGHYKVPRQPALRKGACSLEVRNTLLPEIRKSLPIMTMMLAGNLTGCKTKNLESATSAWTGIVRHLPRPLARRGWQCGQLCKHVRALDRNLIASAATASKEMTKDVPQIVVRHSLDSKACCESHKSRPLWAKHNSNTDDFYLDNAGSRVRA